MNLRDPLFVEAMKFVDLWEGGNVDDPDDPGGRTSGGVTQAVYDAYRRRKGLKPQDVFKISKAERLEIYWNQYWVPSRAAYIQHRYLAIVVMDTAVNFGVARSGQFMFEAAGVPGWGEALSALVHREVSANRLADRIVALRMQYRGRRVLDTPTQVKFLNGWLNRDNALLRVGKL